METILCNKPSRISVHALAGQLMVSLLHVLVCKTVMVFGLTFVG